MREDGSSAAERAVPENSLGFLLWQVSQSWRRHFVAGLKPCELTDLEFCILSGVDHLTRRTDEPPSQVAVAKHIAVNVMTVSQLVRRLEKRGLIRRRRHATDSRARVLSLTTVGEHTLADALKLVDASHQSFFRRCDHQSLSRQLGELYEADHPETLGGTVTPGGPVTGAGLPCAQKAALVRGPANAFNLGNGAGSMPLDQGRK